MSVYTVYQRKYIDSVDGAAHQSAVAIIGELEDLVESKEREIKNLQATCAWNDNLIADYQRERQRLLDAERDNFDKI